MKNIVIQPQYVRALGNVLDNEDNIKGMHCKVEAQNSTTVFENIQLKTYYMGTGTHPVVSFIAESVSMLPDETIHIDVMVKDEDNNPLKGADLYIYENDILISQLETGEDGIGVNDSVQGFNYTSEITGKHIIKCVLPRQDTYLETTAYLTVNVLENTVLTLNIIPNEIDTLTETVTLYGTLTDENNVAVAGETISFYNGKDKLGEGITDDNGTASLTVAVGSLIDNTLFAPKLKSLNEITVFDDFEQQTFKDTPVIEDNVLVVNYGNGFSACILNRGWDNTDDWQFDCDMMQNYWDSGFELVLGIAEKYMDYTPYRILRISSAGDNFCGIAGRENNEKHTWTKIKWGEPSFSANEWTHVTVIKRNKLFTVKINDDIVCSDKTWEDSENYDRVTVSAASWGNSKGSTDPSGVKIKNITVNRI